LSVAATNHSCTGAVDEQSRNAHTETSFLRMIDGPACSADGRRAIQEGMAKGATIQQKIKCYRAPQTTLENGCRLDSELVTLNVLVVPLVSANARECGFICTLSQIY
jgi:hypothetical protein